MIADIQKKISGFSKLGIFLSQFTDGKFTESDQMEDLNSEHKENFLNIIEKSCQHNPWFTPDFIYKSLEAWARLLRKEELNRWLLPYSKNYPLNKRYRVGLVMAGNIPLVGFHDFLSVLICGHIAHIKLSSKDEILLPAITGVLTSIDPDFDNQIEFTEEHLENIDAVIATGSDNSSRYFEYYFGKYPHIIRKNRNSIAILDGNESEEELKLLADDVFMYFGLGCRNISKVYLPQGFDPTVLLDNFDKYKFLGNHHKFVNNHDYQKAILLVNKIQFYDNDFLVLREDEKFSSPVGCLNYQFYNNPDALCEEMKLNREKIQCIVSHAEFVPQRTGFGKSQYPALNEYADNIDTIDFLLNLPS